jgi:hypothetical protein
VLTPSTLSWPWPYPVATLRLLPLAVIRGPCCAEASPTHSAMMVAIAIFVVLGGTCDGDIA